MKTLFLAASILFFTGYSSHLISQTPTEGEMTFTVRTVTVNGNFSPKHVLAIWVEDSNGFVLSRKLRAVKRKEYLYTWNTQSGGNVVDAVTGETLLSHQTHTVSWDCKDVNGNLVPDGQYTVYVEFTEAHEQGPLKGIVFTKGSEPVSLAPVDDANFKDLALSFEPVIAVTAAYTFVAENLTVTFTNTSTGAASYGWDFGDGNSSTEENPVHTYTDAGTYAVILTAEAGSSSATHQESVTVSSPVGISDSYATVPQVYPNPTSGIVMINLDGQTGSSTIKIFNLGGSLLYSEQKYNPGIHMINISGYKSGTYLFQVDHDTHSSFQLIIKE